MFPDLFYLFFSYYYVGLLFCPKSCGLVKVGCEGEVKLIAQHIDRNNINIKITIPWGKKTRKLTGLVAILMCGNGVNSD